MNWPVLIGSIIAILVVALVARMLKLGGAALDSEADAMQVAAQLIPDFQPISAIVGVKGQAAIVFAEGDRVFVRRHGAHFVARHLAPNPVVTRDWTVVTIGQSERLFGPFQIDLATEAEARELTRMLGSDPESPDDAASS